MSVTSPDPSSVALRRVLAETPPFRDLPEDHREELATHAEIRRYRPGELIMDGFAHPATDVFLVLEGRVGLKQQPNTASFPDETVRTGGFFGYSSMLTGRTVGPRARAFTPALVARIPGNAADDAFTTPAGTRFLADNLLDLAAQARELPGFITTGSLVDQEPTVVDATTPITEVARQLTDQRRPGIVVRLADGDLGLVTDGSLRRRVLVEGVPADAPVAEAVAPSVLVDMGDSAGETLAQILEAGTEAAIVTDRAGLLKGVVGLREFSLSPTTADVALHEQLHLASSLDDLVTRSRLVPNVLGSLLTQGLSAAQIIRVHSGLVDVIVRRALELCLENYPDLSMDGFTWFALGSHGRREGVLSSDIDSAVVFPDATPPDTIARYRALFAEVEELLTHAGFAGDTHGLSAGSDIMTRTESEWRSSIARWLRVPSEDEGGMKLSFLVDSRPVFGDLEGTAAIDLQQLRNHPATIRGLLQHVLDEKPRIQRFDVPWRRHATFDIKRDALRPLVNLGRWIALAVHTDIQSTPERIRAAAGTDLLAPGSIPVLEQAFEVLQGVRLRHQLQQVKSGQTPSNIVPIASLTPIDRRTIGEIVNEIGNAQKRLGNVAAYSSTEDWKLQQGRS